MTSLGHRLRTPVTVYRDTFAPDGRGGRTATTASVGTALVYIDVPSPQELLVAQEQGSTLTHVIYAMPDSDIARGDWIDDGGDTRYRVLDTWLSARHSFLRVDCERRQGG